MTPLRFRAWHPEQKKMYNYVTLNYDGTVGFCWNGTPERVTLYPGEGYNIIIVMQSTGLSDKNKPCAEVFEGDIVSLDGLVIGNQWQDPSLLEDSFNLLIEGFGTKAGYAALQKAMDRGLSYPQ